MKFYLKLIKPVAEDVWCGQGCRPQKDIILEDIWYLEDEEERLTEKYEKVVYDTYCRMLNFQMKTISIDYNYIEDFLSEYEEYIKCKKELNKYTEDIVKAFEEEYFTQTF